MPEIQLFGIDEINEILYEIRNNKFIYKSVIEQNAKILENHMISNILHDIIYY
jgi:hypothetical protein